MIVAKIGQILTKSIAKYKKPISIVPKTLIRSEKCLSLTPLNTDVVQLTQKIKYSQQEIIDAYRKYAKSPYININMRKGLPLSEEGAKIRDCLEQAIEESEPLTGKFYRGIISKGDDVTKEYILHNLGFTSTVPEINKDFANCFTTAGHSALIEFDIKTSIKGFKASSYEVVFNPNTFNADKYEIIKIKDGFFRVVEKS